ncbi:hypothetical protein QYM36_000675 [Artemia franciscana]|uniref:1-alkyl-2-acetylglycerophosphocholine esterase n=2 Tax=Artemia franciscana TaxID=6661 RepID=A0AA88ICZ1_ARTSF|nr:hypothetical protein QYM36_000675 [Artemia franciscana]KAK2726307.1 hypothetical protein QYM36_000675 [Artemia franciscana]
MHDVLVYKGKYHIPVPSGKYVVGTLDVMTPGSENEGIFARFYYPAEGLGHYAAYKEWPLWLPHPECYNGLATVTKALPLPVWLKAKIIGIMWNTVHIPTVPSAKPIKKPHPFIMFSHGLGANRTMYSSISMDLASHGFFVMNIEHREQSACASFKPSSDGEGLEWIRHQALTQGSEEDYPVRVAQLDIRIKELSRGLDLVEQLNAGTPVVNVLDKGGKFDLTNFKGIIDLSKPVLMGHSFGGATTLVGLSKEPRFKAGALLDPWLFGLRETISQLPEEIDKPLLTINMEDFVTKEKSLAQLKAFLSSRSEVERVMCTIRGTVHYNQTDVPFATSRRMKPLGGSVSETGEHVSRQLNIAVLRLFLHRQLGLKEPRDCHDIVREYETLVEKIQWFDDRIV